jgi:hypothetical protein
MTPRSTSVAKFDARDNKPVSPGEFAQKIVRFDKRIRACSILDEKGNLLHQVVKDKVIGLIPQSEQLKLLIQTALQVGIDKMWDKYLGSTCHIIITREKITIMIFPLADMKSIMITAQTSFPTTRLAKLGRFIDSIGLSFQEASKERFTV